MQFHLGIHYIRWKDEKTKRRKDLLPSFWQRNYFEIYRCAGSMSNGSFRRERSNLPKRTILPISTSSCSRFNRCSRTRSNFSSVSSSFDSASSASFSSFSCWHCSSRVRWKTADTRSRIICSWLIVSKLFHVSTRFLIFSRFSESPSLHDVRRAHDASNNWFPYSKIRYKRNKRHSKLLSKYFYCADKLPYFNYFSCILNFL